jgi:putative ABC transport system substrate-binding protein
MADPVGDELVASLGRPGGNVTGTTFLGPELVPKRLQLLRDVVPGLVRVAALWHPHAYGEPTMANIVKSIEDAARTLGMQLQLVPADRPDEIASAFTTMEKERADAFIVMPSPMLFGEHQRIVELAANSRLPGMYQAREFVDAGGLMSYGANLDDLFRRTATYVDKILKGAKPAELPVERPTKLELVINVKTAGLKKTGYIEGRNVAIKHRLAEGHFDRVPALAAELVADPVALIIAIAPSAALAAKTATSLKSCTRAANAISKRRSRASLNSVSMPSWLPAIRFS